MDSFDETYLHTQEGDKEWADEDGKEKTGRGHWVEEQERLGEEGKGGEQFVKNGLGSATSNNCAQAL